MRQRWVRSAALGLFSSCGFEGFQPEASVTAKRSTCTSAMLRPTDGAATADEDVISQGTSLSSFNYFHLVESLEFCLALKGCFYAKV